MPAPVRSLWVRPLQGLSGAVLGNGKSALSGRTGLWWKRRCGGFDPCRYGDIRTLWLPNYAEDYGKWKITLDVPNWPGVEAELGRLAARVQV